MIITGKLDDQESSYFSVAEEIKAAISERVANGDEVASFEDVRKAEGKTAEEWPDGFVHQAAIDLGLKVEV